MARATLKVKGIKKLKGKLKRNADLNDVKNIVKMNTSEMQRNMQRSASFTKGYQTGTTKRSIALDILDNGFTGKAGPGTEYSPYLIYGTRFMVAQDFFRPNFFKQRQKFINDMKRIMG
ncbi:HK97-gp10 family putative phage morphogenesis protein [Paraliobacillus ryukyuensis]|uniref:HK97-gp10 family putative phage morphogenesis protein n=1 Tax=Paraliobacillus ryukyuensis TaxID=200904 RepID=UPI0009A8AA29|nr:HK97-gp10 family putative phage morphogenesis protein [Paraliobacillus ryukyuensis]